MTALAAAGPVPGLEEVTVGHSVCLFRPDNRAAALLNPSAARICARLLSRQDLSDTDGLDIAARQLARQLMDAGFRDAVDTPPTPPNSATSFTTPPHAPAEVGVYAIGDGPCAGLACDDDRLATLLGAVLAPLRAPVCADPPPSTLRVATGSDGLASVWRDRVLIGAGLDLAAARRVALQSMVLALQPEGHVAAILHASAVAKNGRAILLAGPSGSGKSTLAMSLLSRDCAYIADDFAPLAHDGRTLRTFPVAASIKSGSFATVARRFPSLAGTPSHHVGERTVRYLDLSAHREPATALAPALIVAPRYRADGTSRVEVMSPEETLAELLTTGTEIVGHPRSIWPLAALVNETPALRITFADTEAACRIILDAVAQP